jgi:hypothetical protein
MNTRARRVKSRSIRLAGDVGGKGKEIPVIGHGGSQGCERLRLTHYLGKRLIDGGKVVSPTSRPHFTPRFLYF